MTQTNNSITSEFPLLCETCLGENPYLRMSREKYGKACKICDRPFTVFRWKPGPHARFKKTEICPTCARLKNVCQTCILDLEFGLPVQIRDKALTDANQQTLLAIMPVSTTNRNYIYEQLETRTGIGREGVDALLPYSKMTAISTNTDIGPDHNENKNQTTKMLSKLQRKAPFYKRNLPHICSFYVKGTCNRGEKCPYRHIMPKEGELSEQNIKDRFYGVNDPVAKQMLKKVDEWESEKKSNQINKKSYFFFFFFLFFIYVFVIEIPEPPKDLEITTLFIGGLNSESDKITDDDLRVKFHEFGDIANVKIVENKHCAFVTFEQRISAENCNEKVL